VIFEDVPSGQPVDVVLSRPSARVDRVVVIIVVALVATALVAGRGHRASQGASTSSSTSPPSSSSSSPSSISSSALDAAGEPASIDLGGVLTQPPANLDVEVRRLDGSLIVRRIDLGSGEVTKLGAVTAAGPMEAAPGGSVVVDDGRVSVIDRIGTRRVAVEGDEIQPGPDESNAWIHTVEADGTETLQLVDLSTRVVTRRLIAPAGTRTLVAGGADPVVDTTAAGAYRIDGHSGIATRITAGVLQSYRDGWFTDLTCDDHLACVITLHAPAAADRVIVRGDDTQSTTATVGPSGRQVVLTHRARPYRAPSYEVYDVASGVVVRTILVSLPLTARPRWSIDGRWLFLASSDTIAVLPPEREPVLVRIVPLGRLVAFTLTGP